MLTEEYFILRIGCISLTKEELLIADCVDDIPLIAGMVYRSSEPIENGPLLTFSIDKTEMLPDFVDINGVLISLISQRLESLLHEKDIRFTTYPCRIIDSGSGTEFEPGFSVFHLLDTRSAIDKAHSVITHSGRTIEKLVISDTVLEAKPLLFRELEGGYSTIVYIHRSLLADFEAAGISGYDVTPLSKYRWNTFFGPHFEKLPLPG